MKPTLRRSESRQMKMMNRSKRMSNHIPLAVGVIVRIGTILVD
jgi:hypothetical protein